MDVLFCGHVHTGRPVEVVDGIRICKAPAAGNTAQLTDRWDEIETTQGFSLCSVTDGGIDVTYVLGDDQSADESDTYGPGGHPTLQARDYSIAPEQPPLAPDPWLLES